MNNPLIEEVRSARAARAESLDYDPRKIAEWARAAHAERQKKLESKMPTSAEMLEPGESCAEIKQGAATSGCPSS